MKLHQSCSCPLCVPDKYAIRAQKTVSETKKVLALDISTKTGWAVFEDGKPVAWGTLFPDRTSKDFGGYPANFTYLARHLTRRLSSEIIQDFAERAGYGSNPDFSFLGDVIIEETNSSRQNYSQKLLEFIHFCVVEELISRKITPKYVRTGEWRSAVNARQTPEEKRLNARISRIKQRTGKKLAKIDGKVVGKKGRKHVAIRVVGELLGIQLKRKEEDAADALLLGLGFLKGAPICDGTPQGGKSKRAA